MNAKTHIITLWSAQERLTHNGREEARVEYSFVHTRLFTSLQECAAPQIPKAPFRQQSCLRVHWITSVALLGATRFNNNTRDDVSSTVVTLLEISWWNRKLHLLVIQECTGALAAELCSLAFPNHINLNYLLCTLQFLTNTFLKDEWCFFYE